MKNILKEAKNVIGKTLGVEIGAASTQSAKQVATQAQLEASHSPSSLIEKTEGIPLSKEMGDKFLFTQNNIINLTQPSINLGEKIEGIQIEDNVLHTSTLASPQILPEITESVSLASKIKRVQNQSVSGSVENKPKI